MKKQPRRATKAPTRTPPTAEQIADARRLHSIWMAWKEARRAAGEDFSQTWIGEQFPRHISQAAVGMYIRGEVALNTNATIEFARIFGVSVSDISPSTAKSLARAHARVQESSMAIEAQMQDLADLSFVTDSSTSATKVVPDVVFVWEKVVEMYRDGKENLLPVVFCLAVPDSALIGRLSPGDVVKFDRTLAAHPRPGDGVLVKARGPAGEFFAIRIYTPRGDGTFSATATNPHFHPLDSEQNKIEILAVITGAPECRWGA